MLDHYLNTVNSFPLKLLFRMTDLHVKLHHAIFVNCIILFVNSLTCMWYIQLLMIKIDEKTGRAKHFTLISLKNLPIYKCHIVFISKCHLVLFAC